MGQKSRGTLVIIGGAEDKTGDQVILREFLKLAGGRDARVAVITAATVDQAAAGDKYSGVFRDLGARSVFPLNLDTRYQAMQAEASDALREASGIFLTGGDQLRITSILGGTRVYAEIQRMYVEGTVIAGTSAGASAMSGAMIVGGDDLDTAKDGSVVIGPGLGLLEEVVVDQHFCQRGRIGRLLAVVAQNPYIIGLGIDEDTAVVVGSKGTLSVVGNNSVTVVDGSSVLHSNVTETHVNRILALTNVTLSVLPSGYGFDLKTRRAILPERSG